MVAFYFLLFKYKSSIIVGCFDLFIMAMSIVLALSFIMALPIVLTLSCWESSINRDIMLFVLSHPSNCRRKCLHIPTLFTFLQIRYWFQPKTSFSFWCCQWYWWECWSSSWYCLQQVPSLAYAFHRWSLFFPRFWSSMAFYLQNTSLTSLSSGKQLLLLLLFIFLFYGMIFSCFWHFLNWCEILLWQLRLVLL